MIGRHRISRCSFYKKRLSEDQGSSLGCYASKVLRIFNYQSLWAVIRVSERLVVLILVLLCPQLPLG